MSLDSHIERNQNARMSCAIDWKQKLISGSTLNSPLFPLQLSGIEMMTLFILDRFSVSSVHIWCWLFFSFFVLKFLIISIWFIWFIYFYYLFYLFSSIVDRPHKHNCKLLLLSCQNKGLLLLLLNLDLSAYFSRHFSFSWLSERIS